jgi:hypothetical protein
MEVRLLAQTAAPAAIPNPNPNDSQQHVNNTRTVKTTGATGMESFTTVVLDSIHYESYLMATNCGPLGLKADVEPNTNRTALSDRSIAHVVSAADDDETGGDVDFDVDKCSDEMKARINMTRVLSCLTAYVLVFIKHQPHFRPNLTYANMLCNEWNNILWREYNLPRPSKRKKIKLRMTLEQLCVQSAVHEKFAVSESAVDFADMVPDANGNLSPFCIEQLADVVTSLQRCLDLEVIHTAWSHSLDHSPATSSHVFQMKTVLSQLHGNPLDRRTLVGEMPRGHDDIDDAHLHAMMDEHEASADATSSGAAPSAAAAAAAAPAAAAANPSSVAQGVPLPPQFNDEGRGPYGTNDDDPLVAATSMVNGANVCHVLNTRQAMHDGMTRRGCEELANELATERALRAEYSVRTLSKKVASSRNSATVDLIKVFDDGEDKRGQKMHRMSSGKVISASRAAGACMPNVTDVMAAGHTESWVKDVLSGQESGSFGNTYHLVGIQPSGWEYECLNNESTFRGPADYDFNWSRLSAFTKGGGNAESSGKEGKAMSSSASGNRSIWTNSTKIVKSVTRNSKSRATSQADRPFSLMDVESMTFESMRDTLYLMAQGTPENKVRIPVFNFARRNGLNSLSKMKSRNQPFSNLSLPQTIHPNNMFRWDADGNVVHDEAFQSPKGIDRPIDSTVATSSYQKRLDHLTNYRSLPACIAPDACERGNMIKESEEINGFYFSKAIASEHSHLVLEMGMYLSNVPGIMGAEMQNLPPTFRVQSATYKEVDRVREEMEEDNYQEELARQQERTQGGPSGSSPASARPEDPDPATVRQDEFPAYEDAAGDEEDDDIDDEDDAGYEAPPPLVDGSDNSDLLPLESDVTNPGSSGTGIRAEPGASMASAAKSVEPDAAVTSIPYSWDMSATFLSCRMVETLHNDSAEYVDSVRAECPDVFGHEDREVTLRDLPQISMRFPGLEEKDKKLQPLSRPMPLTQSRVSDIKKNIASARASRGLSEAVHSFAQGRCVKYNDPEVQEREAEARGIDSNFVLEGNVFARSTWLKFTMSALDARGMLTPAEARRVNDQGLNLRLRVRNARAHATHAKANKHLNGQSLAECRSFAAQARGKRAREAAGFNDDEEGSVELSEGSKRLASERKVQCAIINDMIGNTALFED